MREKSRRLSPGGATRTEEMAEEGVRAMLVMEWNDCKIILQQECTFFPSVRSGAFVPASRAAQDEACVLHPERAPQWVCTKLTVRDDVSRRAQRRRMYTVQGLGAKRCPAQSQARRESSSSSSSRECLSRILGVCSSARRRRRLASKDVDITERVWLQKVLDGARASVRGRHAAWDEGLHKDEEREEDERADWLHRGHFSETGRQD